MIEKDLILNDSKLQNIDIKETILYSFPTFIEVFKKKT